MLLPATATADADSGMVENTPTGAFISRDADSIDKLPMEISSSS